MIQLNRVGELLNFELSSTRFKKNQLLLAYQSLNSTDLNYKKPQLANNISTILTEDLQNYYKQLKCKDLTDEALWKQIYNRLQNKLSVLNLRDQLLSKRIQEFFTSLKCTNITNNIFNNRQNRNLQQIVQNIWTPQTSQIQCLCPKAPTILQQTKKTQKCYRCNQKFHSECFWSPEKSQLFQCPFCYLKYCDPQKEVKEILFGSYLPILKKQKVQYKLNFTLDQKIKTNKYLSIQARCIKFNSKNRYQISWPDNSTFCLGKVKLNQFKPLQTNSALKRRADQPIKLDKNRLIENQILIQQRSTPQSFYKINKKCYHLVAIIAYTQLSKQSVLRKFQKNQLQITQSKNFISNHMSHQTSDILIQKISISLRCQYYSQKIKIPARSRLCNTHVQPFDLMSFITSSISAKSSTRKWKCPICDKRAYDLVVDRYILNLMKQNPNANQIIFKQNGQPEIVHNKQDQNLRNRNQVLGEVRNTDNDKRYNNNVVIDIDLDEVNNQIDVQNIQQISSKLVKQDNKTIQKYIQQNKKQKLQEQKQKQKQRQIQRQRQKEQKRQKQLQKQTEILKQREKEKQKQKQLQKQKLKQKQKQQKSKQYFIIDCEDQDQMNDINFYNSTTKLLEKNLRPHNQQKQRKRNVNAYENQYNKLKKIRKLNDGSLQVIENYTQQKRLKTNNSKNNQIPPHVNLMQLSSDQQKKPNSIAHQIYFNKNDKQQRINLPVKKNIIQNSQRNSQKQYIFREKIFNSSSMKKNNENPQESNQDKIKTNSEKISNPSKHTDSISYKAKNQNKEQKYKSTQQDVILIDSDNEVQCQTNDKTQEELNPRLLQLMHNIKKTTKRQNKIKITQKDQIFYRKLIQSIPWLNQDK